MKKIICAMIILIVFLSANVGAAEGGWVTTGLTAFGSGLALIIYAPDITSDLTNQALCYLTGGVLGGLGLWLAIAGAMRGDTYYAKIKNPLPDVVSITSDGKSTFIGAKFSFK